MNGQRFWAVAWVLVFAAGCALRLLPLTSFEGLGFDESLYRKYLLIIDAEGLAVFPQLCAAYIADQHDAASPAKLPPTRAFYVICGWTLKRVTLGDAAPATRDAPDWMERDPALLSLHRVSAFSGCLLLLVGGLFAFRSIGGGEALGVLALLACSPLLIHMAQHPLIDGFFALWALIGLWALWETLQKPAHQRWRALLGLSVFLMIVTKENAAFSVFAFAGLLLGARALKFAEQTRDAWIAIVLGALFGVATLAVLAGGIAPLVEIYSLLVRKARQLPYAIKTGDGAWYRYLVDLAIFTPATLVFAIGGTFLALAKAERARVFLVVFIALSWIMMCNVRYGMNLRYTTVWDYALRALACGAATFLAGYSARHSRLVFSLLIAGLCLIDLQQYRRFFLEHRIYEPTTESLLRASQILK